jgi:hypothetical protein
MTKRIIFFPDEISGENSGARSARATMKSMKELGLIVLVISKDSNTSEFKNVYPDWEFHLIESSMRFYSHFYSKELLDQFKLIVRMFRPDFFFMVGSIQKPTFLSVYSRIMGIKTIYLFYITDYYLKKNIIFYSTIDENKKNLLYNNYQELTKNIKIKNFQIKKNDFLFKKIKESKLLNILIHPQFYF